MGFITLQELFDSQCEFGAKQVGLLNSMIEVQSKYHHETQTEEGFSDLYYKELKEIADTYEVNYTEPRFRGGLRSINNGVDTSPTIH